MTWNCKWSFNYENVNIFLYADKVGIGISQLLRDTDNGSDRVLAISTHSLVKFPAPLGSREKEEDREVTQPLLKFLIVCFTGLLFGDPK